MPPKSAEVMAIFTKEKRSIVKHWKRTDNVNCLCGRRIILESPHTGVARECPVCLRLKSAFEQQRARELDRLKVWR